MCLAKKEFNHCAKKNKWVLKWFHSANTYCELDQQMNIHKICSIQRLLLKEAKTAFCLRNNRQETWKSWCPTRMFFGGFMQRLLQTSESKNIREMFRSWTFNSVLPSAVTPFWLCTSDKCLQIGVTHKQSKNAFRSQTERKGEKKLTDKLEFVTNKQTKKENAEFF